MKRPLYNAIRSLIFNPLHFIAAIIYRICWLFPDELYLKIIFRLEVGYKLDLINPKTYNAKLQWLKLYDHRPEYTTMVDKVRVKEYVRSVLGDEYIIPTLGVWKHVNEIDVASLPGQFVLKTNHDGGNNGVVVCRDRSMFEQGKAFRKLDKSLKRDPYYLGREWPYKNVERCVFAEQFMADDNSGELKDYKFFCFHGKVKCFKIDFDRSKNHRANYFDRDGRLLQYGELACPPDYSVNIEIPDNINKMIDLAEKLAMSVPFLRVDFYNVNGHIYFGEMTFYPAGGFINWTDPLIDKKWGEWLDLKVNINIDKKNI